ncbi:MAG TPA: FemAB family XrtA/PEP-CTERM system-associated protein [Acetobacteraceae bacterium]|nr:FemAB family XrtA/PEP-CTERM system-associated protein [Acetobacteraceae bacterium]
MVKVRALAEKDEPAWDKFVHGSPLGTFFHLSAWRGLIERVFRHRTYYAFAEQDGAITGVLPLAHVRTRLFGNTLISTPFCVYGGPIAADAESARALQAHAAGLMEQTRVSAVEFRYLGEAECPGWIERPPLYETFRRPLDADDERNMKAIPRKQRAVVRKGIQNGLRSVVQHEAGTLFRVYAESVRNLGTPVFPRRWFAALLERFGQNADVVTVLDGEAPIAAVLNFYFRDEVLPYYGGGTEAARRRAGNDFMYWEVMRLAAARGCKMFDFGRSKIGTGSHAFKHNWGFPAMPLHYHYKLARGAGIPDQNPLNPKYRIFIAAWRRLPLPVANVLGPMIVRGLG